jgi:hypothetical protein
MKEDDYYSRTSFLRIKRERKLKIPQVQKKSLCVENFLQIFILQKN